MSPQVENDFNKWLRRESHNMTDAVGVTGSRLQKVVEIGGEKPGSEHGLSIALQADFPSKAEADKWGETTLPELLSGFMNEFGPAAAYFTTLLESTAFH